MMGTVAQNTQRKEINILRKIVHPVGFIYKKTPICLSTGVSSSRSYLEQENTNPKQYYIALMRLIKILKF
jgi:hypothetical protein